MLAPPALITATTVLILTVAPACTLISESAPAAGGGDFGIHFVGRDLKQRLILLHGIAWLLQPFGDGAFKNRFAHLGHDHVVEGRRRRPAHSAVLAAAAGAGELVALGGSVALVGAEDRRGRLAVRFADHAHDGLIWTVLPSAILTSVRTPLAGEGISASTLSVESQIAARPAAPCRPASSATW